MRLAANTYAKYKIQASRMNAMKENSCCLLACNEAAATDCLYLYLYLNLYMYLYFYLYEGNQGKLMLPSGV